MCRLSKLSYPCFQLKTQLALYKLTVDVFGRKTKTVAEIKCSAIIFLIRCEVFNFEINLL